MEEFMSDEILANLEKHMEGNQLALAAVAEVLQKMDARLLKEEEDTEEEEMEKAAEAEKESLVKSVIAALKADQGMDVDGEKTRSASQGPSGQADEEKPASPTTKIEDQQATIQAMAKAEDDEEEEEDVEKAGAEDSKEEEQEKQKTMVTMTMN